MRSLCGRGLRRLSLNLLLAQDTKEAFAAMKALLPSACLEMKKLSPSLERIILLREGFTQITCVAKIRRQPCGDRGGIEVIISEGDKSVHLPYI
jgi:hypothetical protein